MSVMMKAVFPAMILALTAMGGLASEVTFSSKPTAMPAGGKTRIAFELSAGVDVEVAILDAKGKVVRHLAAGLLGANTPPPPPLKPGLSQKLEWDGKDDYGRPVLSERSESKGPFKVRVRAGMGAKLEQIVGGDPYTFYTPQASQGDHSKMRLTGLEVKPDGNVYIIGNATPYGVATVRQYDAAGNFRRTVFPPPAGKPVDDVKGWGVNVRADGTYTFKSNRKWSIPAIGQTLVTPHPGLCAALVSSSDNETLALLDLPSSWDSAPHYRFLTIGTDGTLKANQSQPLFGAIQLPGKNRLTGPCFSALSPDRKTLYVSGLYSVQRRARWRSAQSVDATGFWRDAQVWKLDLATRKMSTFFALPEKEVVTDLKLRAKDIKSAKYVPCAAFHGVATDAQGRVFVCDRQNKRIAVLNGDGKLIRELPVDCPDAIAVNPKSKALYVTTRYGNYGGKGQLKLLKFNDWSKDTAPAVTLLLSKTVGKFPYNSFLAVAENNPSTGSGKKGEVMVWVAYLTLPVRVYRDTATGLELVKDFYKAGPQRALDLAHMMVDRKTGDAYFSNAWGYLDKITDWKNPKFVPCMASADKRLKASSIGIDARNRYLYTHYHHTQGVYRYKMDGQYYTPAPVGRSGNKITPRISCSWIMSGLGERGIAAAPGGGLATLGTVVGAKQRADDYSGRLSFFKPDPAKAPWQRILFGGLAPKPRTGGVRFDPRGNVYAGVYDRKVNNIPGGFEKDPAFRETTGRIYKYAPTGSGRSGNLFPSAPKAPAKIYDVHYGPLSGRSRTPRFGVDGYGRIYYPTGPMSRVSVIDNQGNPILSFGTWGNRDSMGGLKGDLVPTKDVPLALPNSVDATDDHIYVSDIVNVRLLRLAKTFAAAETVAIK